MTDDLETRRRVFQLAAEGLSTRAIARVVGTSHTTVARMLREPQPPPAELPAHMRPLEPLAMPSGTPSPDASALEIVRELLSEARAQFSAASACGDSAGAQRYSRTASGLMPVLARLEREDREVDGAVRISAAEAERVQADLLERIRAHCARPLLCQKCNRELSVFFGTGVTEAELNADDAAHK